MCSTSYVNSPFSASTSDFKIDSLLPVLEATAQGKKDLINFDILLDSASSHNFVKVTSLKDLNYKVIENNVDLCVNQLENRQVIQSQEVEIVLKSGERVEKIRAFVVENLLSTQVVDLPHAHTIKDLNGTFPRESKDIDLLIGVCDMWNIVENVEVDRSRQITLLKTPWGRVPCGKGLVQEDDSKEGHDVSSFLTGTERLAQILEKMWKYEELPMDSADGSLTRDEHAAIAKIELDGIDFPKLVKNSVNRQHD